MVTWFLTDIKLHCEITWSWDIRLSWYCIV